MIAEVPGIWKWLEATPVGASVRESLWLFPALETLHLLGMALLVVTIAPFDLRLMGVAIRGVGIPELARKAFPWAGAGFAVQVITGALLFSSEATKMVVNPAFQVKMLLIGLAGVNAAAIRLVAGRDLAAWNKADTPPLSARIVGLTSLLLWVGVVAAGRWIGFI